MTRDEFFEQYTDINDLINFAINEAELYDDFYNIYSADALDDSIEEDLNNCGWSWRDIRDSLSEIDDGYAWYIRDGEFCYEGLTDDDLDYYLEEIVQILDDRDWFDPEEVEDSEDECEDESECEEEMVLNEATEDINEFFGMIDAVHSKLCKIGCELTEKENEEINNLSGYMSFSF